MSTRAVFALIAVVTALCLAGCGGGEIAPPPGPTTSAIDGEVEIQGAATDYQVLLNGQPVPDALRDDGTYAIENVPPGRHRIAVVGRDGMEGGYVTVEVTDGRRARAPRIVTEAGGQIVGIVTVIEDGVMRPLEGVEVTAQPAIMILADDGDTPVSDGQRPTIYPPPDLPSFEAFTDEDGSFVIRAMPEGEYTVTVAQPNMENAWRWVRVQAGRTAVADFRLRPIIEPGIGTVEGVVIGKQHDLTAPIMGARVTIVSDNGWGPVGPPAPPEPLEPVEPADEGGGPGDVEPGYPGMPDPDTIAPPYYEGVSTMTDETGAFSLNSPAGYARVEVYAPGWAPTRREITVEPEQTLRLEFVLEDLGNWPPPPPPPGEGEEPPSPPESGADEPPTESEPDGGRPPAPPFADAQ